MNQVIWTVLPNGITGATVKLSLFVSLRLDNPVSSLGNWTNSMQLLTNQALAFDSGPGTPETIVTPIQMNKTLLSTSLWDKAFPSSTQVRPRPVVDHHLRPKYSYPTKEIRRIVREVYQEVGEQNGTFVPNLQSVDEGEILSRPLFSTNVMAPGALVSGWDQTGHPTNYATEHPTYKVHRFYRRRLNETGPERPFVSPTKPNPDFHEALGMLGDHPNLLRRLGLILDVTITTAQLPAGKSRVRFVQAGARTPYTIYDAGFVARAAAGSDLQGRLLMLGDTTRYEVHQLDTDSAALKLLDFGTNVVASIANPSALFVDLSFETPSLQTAGLVVHQLDRATRLDGRFVRSNALEGGADVSEGLYADDVVRGYRVDVQRQSDGVWRSICLRQGSYLLGTTNIRVPTSGDIHDEGFVKGAAATSSADAAPSASEPLYIHEALFSWDGWSAVTKAPGRSIKFAQSGSTAGESVERVATPAEGDVRVTPNFVAEPHTLPKLRFGETYRVRARAVDLAGNSLPLSTATANGSVAVSPPVPYKRYEPVAPPAFVPRNPYVEGESLEHIVIRSVGSGAPTPGVSYMTSNDCHVAPPTVPLELSIQHGMLDPFFGNPTRAYNIALKSEGTFLDSSVWDGLLGIKLPQLGHQIINTPEAAGKSTAAPPRGAGLEPGQYVIHRTDPILPYLPDPLATGFTIFDGQDPREALTFPGLGAAKLNYSGSWPSVNPTHFTVQSTTQATPSLSASLSGALLRIPPAMILDLHSSSVITDPSLAKMAVWDYLSPAKQTSTKPDALNGRFWLITPRRKIKVIHAVQRPLAPTQITALAFAVPRVAGDTFAKLNFNLSTHARSTGQLDIEASWTDPVDPLSEPGPVEEDHAGHVLTEPVRYDTNTLFFGGTPPADESIPKHDFGDTKRRTVRYRADATTRYREYFPASVAATPSNVQVTGPETSLTIPSSARPAAPEILYVVPTFRWTSDTTKTGIWPLQTTTGATSRRVGRGLRVYMSRPWFSSGEGELLGVVLASSSTPADKERKYTSDWGHDPIWTRSGTFSVLSSGQLLNPADVKTGLKLVEDPSFTVTAAGFDVEYNADRKVWFADIEFDESNAFSPFVRLALARYQPESAPDCHLSSIVRAEFAQLVNDRTAALQFGTNTIQVSVGGIAAKNQFGKEIETVVPPGAPPAAPPGFTYSPSAGAGRILTVQVERRSLGQSELEWQIVGGPTVLPSFAPSPAVDGQVLWSGTIPRPVRTLTTFEQRLVIKEYEVFYTDTDVDEPGLAVPVSGFPLRSRLAYLDVIQLDSIGIL